VLGRYATKEIKMKKFLVVALLGLLVTAVTGYAVDEATWGQVKALTNPQPAAKIGGIVHRVSAGFGSVYELGVPVPYTFSITANLYANGSADGVLNVVDHDYAEKHHGRVIDLKVKGNMAKPTWIYTSGPRKGAYGFIVLVDNGEGKKATGPDKRSWALWLEKDEIFEGKSVADFIKMSPSELIAFYQTLLGPGDDPESIYYVVKNGNIQVK
jgi:hypothetical protein